MNWVADVVGERYLLAAEAPMELSGKQLALRDGALALIDD